MLISVKFCNILYIYNFFHICMLVLTCFFIRDSAMTPASPASHPVLSKNQNSFSFAE